LSTCHKRRKKGEIEIYVDGSLLKVSKKRINPYKGGKRDWTRGKITKFSKRSRSRMMRKMAKINKSELPLFVTLTYPKEYSNNSEDWKYDYDKFKRRMKYRFHKFSCIWKLEPQSRGAPHFHLLVWGIPKYGLNEYISMMWYEAVGSGDPKHLRAGTQVQRIRSWRGVTYYVSKYMAKVEELPPGWDFPGRYWGVSYRENIPWSRVEVFEVFQGQIILAMRYMRRYAGIKSRDYSSLSIFVNNPQRWKEVLIS
jgi:hypothetical protein